MKEILVDANVLLSFLTDRDKDQQEQSAVLFRAAADREHTLILHLVTLIEMVHVFIHGSTDLLARRRSTFGGKRKAASFLKGSKCIANLQIVLERFL